MDINAIVKKLENCECGKVHNLKPMVIKIGQGLLEKTDEILNSANFPKKLLVVADKNTLAAADGILDILKTGGFEYTLRLYEDLRTAEIEEVEKIIADTENMGIDGILSVGSGSLNDICRLGSFLANKPFAIFATAPSMDGFAADSAPITYNSFKRSTPCHAPSVIIGDTDILAAAPSELKAAGFGDIMAKYVALVDWQISNLVSGENYCPQIADITRQAIEKVVLNVDKIQDANPEAAGILMEALILSGLAMTLHGSIRPASGAEHVISHYWEMKKLSEGKPSDFHGKKVGVATLLTTKIYHKIIDKMNKTPNIQPEKLDWDAIYADYGDIFKEEIFALNNPSIMKTTNPQIIAENREMIRDLVSRELPSFEELHALMKRANAATTIYDIGISPELAISGMKFHPYMRQRILLTRLLPTLGIEIDYNEILLSDE